MIHQRLLVGIALALLALAPAAQAQYGRNDEVTCESQDGRTRECRTPFRNPVVSETLSSAPCIEGRTWGNGGGGMIWVTDGCRARFVDGRGGWQPQPPMGGQGAVRCESQDGRTRECAVPVGRAWKLPASCPTRAASRGAIGAYAGAVCGCLTAVARNLSWLEAMDRAVMARAAVTALAAMSPAKAMTAAKTAAAGMPAGAARNCWNNSPMIPAAKAIPGATTAAPAVSG